MWTLRRLNVDKKNISVHLRYTERPGRCDIWAAADIATHKGLNLKDRILDSETSGVRSKAHHLLKIK